MPGGALTSHVTRVYSDGFDLDQYFVLAHFWNRNFLKDDVLVLLLSSALRGAGADSRRTDLVNESFASDWDLCG